MQIPLKSHETQQNAPFSTSPSNPMASQERARKVLGQSSARQLATAANAMARSGFLGSPDSLVSMEKNMEVSWDLNGI